MNIFRLFGDFAHLASILILIHKIQTSRSARGISFKSQVLYSIVFVTRYLDIFTENSFYRFVMKCFFIGSSLYIVYLMRVKFRCVARGDLSVRSMTPTDPFINIIILALLLLQAYT